MTEFSALMQQLAQPGADGSYSATVTDDWLQGRTVYGGMVAALCLQTALSALKDLPPLRSAQFGFIGPATGVLKPHVSELRRGKSAVYVTADCVAEAGLATRALFCFGTQRSVAHTHFDLAPPSVASPERCPEFFSKGRAPTFAQHFDGRLAAGQMLFSDGTSPDMTLWLRHRDPELHKASGNGALLGLLALADACPPAAFVLYDTFVPISTMTWQIDIVTDELSTDDGWWLLNSKAESMALGYSGQAMTIWNGSGRPIAAARQTIAMFG